MLLTFHLHYLRGNIPRSATSIVEVGLVVAEGCQSEVDQHWLPAGGRPQHHVLQFNVTVHNPKLVEIGEPFQESFHDFSDLFERKAAATVDAFEEVSAKELFGEHVEGSAGLDNAVNFDDVGVI